jgi:diguanylate cyclase (GGDEF)-like protein
MEKKTTNLRLKFILALGGFGIVCSLGISLLNYFQHYNYIISSMQNTLRDAGELLESQMPVLGEVDYIRQEGAAGSEAYMDILKEMKKYSDAFGFTFIYLLENSAAGFIFLLDTDKLNKNSMYDDPFLTEYDELSEFLSDVIKSRQIMVSDIYTDKYGTFMSAFVPITRQDRVVSIIGLDYEVSHVRSLERRVLLQVIFSLIITTAFVIIMAIVISKAFVYLVKNTDDLNKKLIFANEKLEELSTTDELTGLNNRRSFLRYMDIVWKQCHRLKLPITVLMIDVDYFKQYNDTLGHLEGDKALIAVAQCIRSHAKRETDFVARIGGEEFVCLLPFTEKNGATDFAKTLVAHVEEMKISHPKSEISEYLTISLGMADAVPDKNGSHAQLLEDADRALYAAKNAGRNRAVVG